MLASQGGSCLEKGLSGPSFSYLVFVSQGSALVTAVIGTVSVCLEKPPTRSLRWMKVLWAPAIPYPSTKLRPACPLAGLPEDLRGTQRMKGSLVLDRLQRLV